VEDAMMRHSIYGGVSMLILLVCTGLALSAAAVSAADAPSRPSDSGNTKFTFVIVHGAWGGGWSWKTVDQLLTADGNTVYRPTLTGLGERVHLASPDVGLSTHISDIVNVIKYEDLHNIVLVGHSYGGMVITGVAEQVPDRIAKIIYLDAFLPQDGECVNSISPTGPKALNITVKDGFAYLSGTKANATPPADAPQPQKTFSEAISVKNPAAAKLPGAYVLFVNKGTQPADARFYKFYQRAEARGFTVTTLESDHNAWRSHPKELSALLEKLAQ
jgi:pimeloyl-ACP methyl ester carboxylesterase